MKLLLVFLLGLAVAVRGQEPDDFVVLNDEPSSDDFDAGELIELGDEAQKHLDSIGKSRLNTTGLDCFDDRPGPYSDLAKSSDSGAFSVSGDAAAVEPSARRQVSAKGGECYNLPAYHCPHTTNILYWFPIRWGFKQLHAICYVPWAGKQRITYATCNCRTCNLYGSTGLCRPSCYERRRMLVWCYYFNLGQWSWHWQVRSLPQACTCSGC